MATGKISATIITFNEERNIARCIDSLSGIADEIIVVDSFSKDKTKDICLEKKVTFIQNQFHGHIEQKNFALGKARFDHVISLDADEALDETLRASVLQAKREHLHRAYTFNRLTNYCGHWVRHCGWYPDQKLRLWKKDKGKWGGDNPHDKVIMTGDEPARHLPGNILHYSFCNVEEHIKQIHYFTDISARSAFRKGKKSNVLNLVFNPAFKFFHDYFLKAGFLDGYYGFVISLNSAYAKYLKYLKLLELNRGKLT